MVSIVGFLKNNKNKRMTIKSWAYAAFYRFQIAFFSRKRLEKHWGVLGEETDMRIKPWQVRYARWVSQNVNRVCEHTPWESKCLVRALTARKLLLEKGISCTLYLGVGKDEKGAMIAHAWIRTGPYYVTGGNGEEFATVATFKNEGKPI